MSRLRRIERQRVALLEGLAALDPALLVARPLPGKWSIREIVEHLVLAERSVVGDFARLDDLEDRPRGLKHRVLHLVVMFILRFGIPVRVPAAAMVPTGERSFAELRETWDEQHRRLRAFVDGLDRRGARRAIFRHPVCGPLTVAQGLRMLDVHLGLHIRQIRQLEQRLRDAGRGTVSLSAWVLPLTLTAAAGLWLVDPVRAQTPADSALLSIPAAEEKVACRVPPPDTTPPIPERLTVREFRIGGAAAGPIDRWPRRVLVAADAAGHLALVYDAVIVAASGGAHVMARFPASGDAAGWHQQVAVDSTALAALLAAGSLDQLRNAATYGPQRPLDPSELVKARALAVWLWERRCGRS